jgi:hypothetical protein
MIVPSGHVDAAVGRVPVTGQVVLQLLALNHDRHGLPADVQCDHFARSHARNLTPSVGQSWQPRRTAVGAMAVLSTVRHHCSAASVNRKLARLTSFCEFHARHGMPLAGAKVTMRAAQL